MSAVERIDDRDAIIVLQRDITIPTSAATPKSRTGAQENHSTLEQGRNPARGERLRPLLALAPYLARYRGKTVASLIALTVASLATLAVPLAVRRMIDFGFTADSAEMINSYFSLMIAVVALLALASASRVYLVTTLGERIVADLRRDVFSHLTSLSPKFFDSASSGELVSRLTADTTQIKAAVVVSISTALRNLMLFAGAATMMVVFQPAAVGRGDRGDTADRAAFGRVRTKSANAVPGGTGYARSGFFLRGGIDRRDAHLAGVHQRAAGHRTIRRRGGARLYGRPRFDPRARDPYRHRHFPDFFQHRGGVVGRLQRRAERPDHGRPAQPVPALCSTCRWRLERTQPGLGRRIGGLRSVGAAVRNPAPEARDRRPGIAPRVAAACPRRR